MSELPFLPFSKIPRLNRNCIITEKIDGTNAQIYITDSGEVIAGSRSRWIYPGDDNFGFASWVKSKEESIRTLLGPGQHFGEWWGKGIQRGYGLSERRFSLFNTTRWESQKLPEGIDTVPLLYKGPFNTNITQELIEFLKNTGSQAVKGFMKPEGIVIYHEGLNGMFKVTCEKDESPKGLSI